MSAANDNKAIPRPQVPQPAAQQMLSPRQTTGTQPHGPPVSLAEEDIAWDDDDDSRPTCQPETGAAAELQSFVEADTATPSDSSRDGEAPDSYVGTTLGDRYVIDKLLGEGGMGKVYRAHHKVIEKKVAIKILHAELAKDKEAVGRFLREARAASSIGNPHIIDIVDFGESPDGSTYFVMEYLKGESLGDMLEQRGKLPPDLLFHVAIQLCDGLAAAHEQQIVHRDLKPDNIILVKPQGTFAGQSYFCKILDFGIAKVSGQAAANTKLTMAGQVFGTPHYMSPEQAAGEAIDHRTDIYSLGVMLYEMVSGEMPFNADNFMGILTQHMYRPPPSLRSLPNAADCPPALEAIILKCLSKKREARYQTMLELAEDIEKLRATGVSNAAHELSAGGSAFHAPAAYYGATPAPAPAADDSLDLVIRPKNRTTWWLVAAAAAALAVGGVVLRQRGTSGNEAAADPAASNQASIPATATAAAPAPGERGVLLHAYPAEAYAIVGDKRITLPDTISVPQGKTVSVKVEAGDGYLSQTIELDGSEPKKKITLERRATGKPANTAAGGWRSAASAVPTLKAPPPPPITAKKQGSPELVDPW